MIVKRAISTWVHGLSAERVMMHHDRFGLLLSICFGLLFAPALTSAQCTIVCKSALNVSLPPSGTVTIQPDILLEDDDCDPLDFYVDIMDPMGNGIGNTVDCNYVGESLLAGVFHTVNGNSCFTTLNIQDYIRPQFDCRDTTILCIQPYAPQDLGNPTVTDNCSLAELNSSDELIELACLTVQGGDTITSRIERTWTAVDASGNTATCVQNIYLKRATISDVQFPSHRDGFAAPVLDCMDDPNDLSLTGEPMVAGRVLSAGGTCEFVVSHSDQTIADCGINAYKILRTWTVIDWCTGEFTLNVQIIKVTDTTAPNLQCPADIVVGTNGHDCLASINLPLTFATDDCSSVNITPSWTYGTGYGPFDDVPLGNHIVTYTAEDACGNTSTCTMQVTVVDDIIPIMVCDANTVVYLNSAGMVEIAASAFDDGSSDNCALDRLEVSRDGIQYAPQVGFDCLDTDQVIDVYLRAYDVAGNYNECMVEVTVREEVRPVMVCPNAATISCTDDPNDLVVLGEAIAVDACGIDTIFYADVETFNSCGVGNINRTWTAVDVFGNSKSCLQQILVEDPTPVQVFFPADYTTYSCGAAVDTSVTGQPNILYDCEQVSVNFDDQVFDIAAPACYKIFRTWTVVDWCVYVPNSGSTEGYYTDVQVISVLDQDAPILQIPTDTLVGAISTICEGTYVTLDLASATDCHPNVSIQNDSPYADAAGADASGFYPLGSHVVQFTAADGCGNSTTASMTIVVEDASPPTVLCLSQVSLNLTSEGTAVINPAMVLNSAYDNCTATENLVFDLSRDTFYCIDQGEVNIQLLVTDELGNSSSCETTVQVQDNGSNCAPTVGTVSGRILNENGKGIEAVYMDLSGSVDTTILTDADGFYTFNDLPLGGQYQIRPRKEYNYDNGVNTFDLIQISRHILGMLWLDSPYKIIASDVNESVNTSSFDMVEIRKLLLHIDSTFSGGTSWLFVDADYQFINPYLPLNEDFPQEIVIDQLNGDEIGTDFIAIKSGDVNNSHQTNAFQAGETRNEGPVSYLETKDQVLSKGQKLTIPFLAKDLEQVLGFQFSLWLNPKQLQFVNLKLSQEGEAWGWKADHFGKSHLSEGYLTSSWVNNQSTGPIDGSLLFEIEVEVLSDGLLSEALALRSTYTNTEAYREEESGRAQTSQLALNFLELVETTAAFQVAQNQPNPVRTKTVIPIYLPKMACGEWRIVDMQGRLRNQGEYCGEKGRQLLDLDRNRLGLEQGIYVVQLDWGELGQQSIKMTVID